MYPKIISNTTPRSIKPRRSFIRRGTMVSTSMFIMSVLTQNRESTSCSRLEAKVGENVVNRAFFPGGPFLHSLIIADLRIIFNRIHVSPCPNSFTSGRYQSKPETWTSDHTGKRAENIPHCSKSPSKFLQEPRAQTMFHFATDWRWNESRKVTSSYTWYSFRSWFGWPYKER